MDNKTKEELIKKGALKPLSEAFKEYPVEEEIHQGDSRYFVCDSIIKYGNYQIGDIVYVDLPEVDDEFEKGEDFAAVESVKAASDIFMPIGGKIIEVNEDFEDEPELLNVDAFANWLVRIEIADKVELEELLSADEYEKFLAEEE